MNAVTFDAAPPRYVMTRVLGAAFGHPTVGSLTCTRLSHISAPDLPSDAWVRVRTRLGGVCGSDVAVVNLTTSPAASALSSFPFVLGHENVGDIVEMGGAVRGWSPGRRVVVNPLLCCEPRAITPACTACAGGHHSQCSHFADGALPPGMLIGATRSVGGSWGEEFVAHQTQLVAVPDGVSDREAVLIEPLACCLHALRTSPPPEGSRVLVIGSGTIGILMTAALATLVPRATITVLARHAYQRDHVVRRGASRVVMARGDYTAELAHAADTRLLPAIIGPPWGVGGFDVTYVCAGDSRAMTDALRVTRAGGTIVLLANVRLLRRVDWTPLWLKELTLRGTLAYGMHVHSGVSESAMHEAASVVQRWGMDAGALVTHVFPLASYRRALDVAGAKSRHPSVKVAFGFHGDSITETA